MSYRRYIIINNTSDDINGYIYPIIIIDPHSTGTVTLQNNSDISSNNILTINVLESDVITIDCRLCTFSSLSGVISLSDLGFQDVGNVYIPKFKYGENNITLSGDADFTFKWREPRKVGIA